jgi:hypothetical protein
MLERRLCWSGAYARVAPMLERLTGSSSGEAAGASTAAGAFRRVVVVSLPAGLDAASLATSRSPPGATAPWVPA